MNVFLSYLPLVFLVVLLWVLIGGRIYKVCPWFFAYVAFGVVAGLARLAARFLFMHGTGVHAPTYWITEAGYDVLGILVMYEVLHGFFGILISTGRIRLIFATVFTASIGLSLARAHAAPSHVGGIPAYIVIGEIAVRLVQVFIFAGLVTLVPVLGLRWRQYSFGVATGFGLYATLMLLTTTKLSDFGTRFKLLWGVVSLVAYSVAVLIWIWFFSVPQKTDTPGPVEVIPSPGELEEYKQALRRMR